MTTGGFGQMAPSELDARLREGQPPVILDVRNPDEHAAAHLPGSILIPLSDLPARVGELDPEAEIVVHCRMGGRASQAAAFLAERGFSKIWNLTGGIHAWADQIDPTMPKL